MKRETIFICSCLKISRQCPLKILSQKMQGKSKNTHPLILKSPYHFTIHIPISKIPAKVDISSQDYIYIFLKKNCLSSLFNTNMPAGKGITEPKKLSEDLADICGVEVY